MLAPHMTDPKPFCACGSQAQRDRLCDPPITPGTLDADPVLREFLKEVENMNAR